MARKFEDLTGKQFGKLTAIHRDVDYFTANGQRKTMWLCCCECGRKVVKQKHYLNMHLFDGKCGKDCLAGD